MSIQITAQELADFRADYTRAPVRTRVLEAVRANFSERVDTVMVVVDQSAAEQAEARMPFGINYPVQVCNVHTPGCPRFARLGNVWLTARTYVTGGPSLHELLHGYLAAMTLDQGPNFLIPTAVEGHWGFSSAAGQLGGWASRTQRGDGSHHGTGPQPVFGFATGAFGTFANGGNTVPYSNLELWSMGLIPDSELLPVEVATGAVASTTEAGVFTAAGFMTYSPQQIIARVLPQARPSASTSRALRGLVVLVTTASTVDPTTVASVNGQITTLSLRATPATATQNFWTATGKRATLQLGAASDLAR